MYKSVLHIWKISTFRLFECHFAWTRFLNVHKTSKVKTKTLPPDFTVTLHSGIDNLSHVAWEKKNSRSSKSNVETHAETIRERFNAFAGLFNRAARHGSILFRRNAGPRKQTFNYRKQNKHGDTPRGKKKIDGSGMFARRRIIFRRGGLNSAKVKGDKKWCNC